MSKSLTYVQILIPQFFPDSPGIDEFFTFTTDVSYLPSTIDAIPSIKEVRITPATISLGENLGQRASVEVIFKDHKHIFASESYDSGTFWGKFRGRYGLKLFGRPLVLYRGEVGDALANMEARTFIIESTDGPSASGEYKIIAKDLLKLADGSKAQAPVLNNGFLLNDIISSQTNLTLSPTGIGDEEYGLTGYVNIGGSEVASFARYQLEATNDSFVKVYLKMTQGPDASTTFTDTNAGGGAKTWTAANGAQLDTVSDTFYGVYAGLFDGVDDRVTTPDHADFNVGSTAWTVDFWFNRYGDTGAQGFFGQGNGTAAGNSICGDMTGGNLMRIQASNGATITILTGVTAVTDSAWHHYCASWDATTLRLFLDGTLENSVAFAGPVNNATLDFAVGQQFAAGGVQFQGKMQHFRLSVGVARHVANFTPSSDYPTILSTGDVVLLGRGAFNTTAADHDAQDRVQQCLVYTAQSPAVIINDLLVNYASVSQSYINTTNWATEITTYLNTVYSAVITEPTDVDKLVSELIEQAGLVVWWDDIGQQVRLQVLHAIATTADTYDEDTMIMGSLDVKEQPQKRLTQVYTYFGKINPTVNQDQINNYRSTAFAIDEDAEAEYGSAAIKKIYSRWITDGGRAVADTLNDILLARFVTPPRLISFDVMRGAGAAPALGIGYQISAWPFQDETGAAEMVPVQLTRLNPRADIFEVEAEEMVFTGIAATSPDQHNIIIDANLFNVNLQVMHDSIYSAAVSGTTVTCTIQEGITVGSTSTATPAFDVGTWVAGVTVNIVVVGRIQGKGGTGGSGCFQAFGGATSPVAGSVGGTALYTRRAINLTSTSGEIFGGGGGGGGGGGSTDSISFATGGSGGGGGAGSQGGAGGASGGGLNGPTGAVGDAGIADTGGSGNHGGSAGGTGGGPGLSGSNGSSGSTTGGAVGGAAGSAIDGDSFVTDIGGVGDIRGGQVN